jgi:hypothetical protein
MQAYLRMVAGLRAALGFAPAAWRGAGGVLIPACLAWGMAMSPQRSAAWTGLALVVTLVASAELYRIAALGNAGRIAPRVGRLSIVWLLSLAFFAVLGSLLFVVFLSSAYAVASAGAGFDGSQVRTWAPAVDDRGRVVLGVVAIIGLALLAWAMTRIALASAATIATGRVRVLSAWPLTKGLGWGLLCARAIVAAPAVGAAVLALGGPRTRAAAMTPGAWMLSAFAGLVIGGVWLPLNTGLMAYIYGRRANL